MGRGLREGAGVRVGPDELLNRHRERERGVGRAGFGVGFGRFLLLFYFLSLFSSISYSTNSTKAL